MNNAWDKIVLIRFVTWKYYIIGSQVARVLIHAQEQMIEQFEKEGILHPRDAVVLLEETHHHERFIKLDWINTRFGGSESGRSARYVLWYILLCIMNFLFETSPIHRTILYTVHYTKCLLFFNESRIPYSNALYVQPCPCITYLCTRLTLFLWCSDELNIIVFQNKNESNFCLYIISYFMSDMWVSGDLCSRDI